jgi:hypothetical protein
MLQSEGRREQEKRQKSEQRTILLEFDLKRKERRKRRKKVEQRGCSLSLFPSTLSFASLDLSLSHFLVRSRQVTLDTQVSFTV